MDTTTFVYMAAIGAILFLAPVGFAFKSGRKKSLTIWILAGMGLGILVGAIIARYAPELFATEAGAAQTNFQAAHYFLKNLFIKALKMMIVPIIFTSIMSGMMSLRGQSIGRLGAKTLAYYMTTSLFAIVVGLVLVNVIQPGASTEGIKLETVPETLPGAADKSVWQFWFDFILGLFENPFAAMAAGNILPIITFALLVGYFIQRVPEPYQSAVANVVDGLFQVIMKIVSALLWLAPTGVYAIFVILIAETGTEVFEGLLLYSLAVFLGLVIHATITLPALLTFVGRVSPWRQFKSMSPALMTAFSTSSSSATLPLTLRCVEKRSGISNRTSSFVLPLGATVNMDGTALYECVAAMFIAQIYAAQGYPVDLSLSSQLIVVFTALMASIGAAGIPMAGLVMLTIILKALNLPIEGAGYVLAVDRILDMCRTTVNVWSDSCGAVIIAKSEGETDVLTTWPPPEEV